MTPDMDRDEFKLACQTLLDEAASEHPAKHQGRLAARYLLRSASGESVELMFDKGPKSPPNLWICQRYAGGLMQAGMDFQSSPAASLYQTVDGAGRPRYGRHSALRPMRQLGNADLICFRLRTLGELEHILNRLKAG